MIFTEEERMLQSTVRNFAVQELIPNALEADKTEAVSYTHPRAHET